MAGTLVLTDAGPVPIDEIELGDFVLSRNEETGELGYRQVTQLFVTQNRQILRLKLFRESGEPIVLETTPNHPFWTEEHGWVAAEDLEVGDTLFTASGASLRIGAGTWLQDGATTYNLAVSEFHTYFVGEDGVWVHNTGSRPCPELTANPNDLLGQGYKEASHPQEAAHGRRTFVHPETGDTIYFDKAKPGKPGHGGRNHYHRKNPNKTGDADAYLDAAGNPTRKNSRASHLYP